MNMAALCTGFGSIFLSYIYYGCASFSTMELKRWTSSLRFLILINNLLIFWLIRCLLSLFLRPFNPVLALISLSICCPNRKILVISRLPISINFSPSNPVKKLRTPGSNAMMDWLLDFSDLNSTGNMANHPY